MFRCFHACADSRRVVISEIFTDAGQIMHLRDVQFIQQRARTDTGQLQQLWWLMAPPLRITSLCARICVSLPPRPPCAYSTPVACLPEITRGLRARPFGPSGSCGSGRFECAPYSCAFACVPCAAHTRCLLARRRCNRDCADAKTLRAVHKRTHSGCEYSMSSTTRLPLRPRYVSSPPMRRSVPGNTATHRHTPSCGYALRPAVEAVRLAAVVDVAVDGTGAT